MEIPVCIVSLILIQKGNSSAPLQSIQDESMDVYSHSNENVCTTTEDDSWRNSWKKQRNSSCDSGFGTDTEDWRKELTGCVPGWPTTWQRVPESSMAQERHQMKKVWPAHVIEAELVAQSMLYPRKPQSPVSSYSAFDAIPFQWVEITGFPWDATEQILKAFHSVGTILKKRPIRHGIQLQYAFTVEACRALDFNFVTICSYKVRVNRLLDDPEERGRHRGMPLYSYCWQNPQYPKFCFSERLRCYQQQTNRNCRPYKDAYQGSRLWGCVAYCFTILICFLFYCLGYLWRSFDNYMSRKAVRNDTHPGAGYHCELVNNSVQYIK
ncbi:uncharacterized protein [Drosophila pseudoobscura]|uniref:Nucleoporin NUP35 n=1 Tax=Drosophila pseudoobscura pseudoobscura TaxID=46245 RepID=A0A6I8UXF7_DROPS|nr:uncharacterized protein LOC6902852 isoform X1 [Drosophila pseudoobscura]